jgi:hypothetical protein
MVPDDYIKATFIPLRSAAISLGVPYAWLKAEVKAGRVPHIAVGRRLLVNQEAVANTLREMAMGSLATQRAEGG